MLAEPLIELVGGTDFTGASVPLRILLFSGALSWINAVFGFALIAKERQASALWLNATPWSSTSGSTSRWCRATASSPPPR